MAFKRIFPEIEKVVEVDLNEKYHVAKLVTGGVRGPNYYELPALGSEIQVFRGSSPLLEFYLAGTLTNPRVTVDSSTTVAPYTVVTRLRR